MLLPVDGASESAGCRETHMVADVEAALEEAVEMHIVPGVKAGPYSASFRSSASVGTFVLEYCWGLAHTRLGEVVAGRDD